MIAIARAGQSIVADNVLSEKIESQLGAKAARRTVDQASAARPGTVLVVDAGRQCRVRAHPVLGSPDVSGPYLGGEASIDVMNRVQPQLQGPLDQIKVVGGPTR